MRVLEAAAALGPPPDPTTGVLVLGMHRSGTSALTGIVNLVGVPIGDSGDLIAADSRNAKGYWESTNLTNFQELLLRRLGGSWDAPPTLTHGWERSTRLLFELGRARRIFRHVYGDLPVWIWKDPRTSLTLPFWRRALRPRVLTVIIHRNPLEVARSLAERDGFDTKRSLTLWEHYNRSLLMNANGLPALVLSYDDLVRQPLAVTGRVREFLAEQRLPVRRPSVDEIGTFVDQRLRHTVFDDADLASDPRVTESQRKLFRTLLSLEGRHDQLRANDIME